VGGGRDAVAFPVGEMMRKRRQGLPGHGRRLIPTQRRLVHRPVAEEDDPLFDEREMEFGGVVEERVTPSER
jgi:hypothetical protein